MWSSLLGTVVVLALVAAAVVAVAQPRITVGDPLPQVATWTYREKPDPPKLRTAAPLTKPAAIDLGEPAPLTVAAPDDPLVAAITPLMVDAITRAGDAGVSGIHVIDADGRVLFDSGGTAPLLPASTAKLVTAAAALAAFGPDHTFTTELRAAPPGPGGVVTGDVLLVGGGDPTLVSQAFIDQRVDPDRPQTPIAALADQVVAAGITRIDGSVVGHDDYLEGTPLARGWPPRYLEDLDATPISGLTVDRGLELYTTDAGTVRSRASADPALDAARVLTQALRERGVEVVGEPATTVGEEPPEAPQVLASLDSPSLQLMLAWMVQDSDNHLADTLLRAVGRRVEGEGSFSDGADQAEAVLADLQLDLSTTDLKDGSGLSRDSRVPAALLTALNYRMTRSTVGAVWQDLMAVSGESGTLQRRLVDSIAERRLRGKTGSLADVRALSGAVVGPDGRPLYVTVVSNDLEGPQLASARRLQDLVVLNLAAHLHGCTEIVPTEPPDTGPSGLPPLPTHTC